MTRQLRPESVSLGGKDNYAVDRAAAEEIIGLVPDAPLAARLNRAFLTRVVEFMTAAGIPQFIDVGAGLPTRGNVHEVAQRAAPEARLAPGSHLAVSHGWTGGVGEAAAEAALRSVPQLLDRRRR